MRFLLDQRLRVPHEMVAPRSRRWGRVAVDDGEIHALGRSRSKLLLQRGVRAAILGEQHDSRRVAIDPMHDQGLPLPVRPQMIFDLIEDRDFLAAPLERDRQQPGGLVEHDQKLIFVKDSQRSGREWRRAASSTAGAILPHADLVAGFQSHPDICLPGLRAVHEHLAPLSRRRGARPRSHPIRRRQELVERKPCLGVRDTPRSIRHLTSLLDSRLWTLDWTPALLVQFSSRSPSAFYSRFVAVCRPCATSGRIPIRL